MLEFVKMRALISAFIRERDPSSYTCTDDNVKSTEETFLIDSKKASIFGESEGDLLLW